MEHPGQPTKKTQKSFYSYTETETPLKFCDFAKKRKCFIISRKFFIATNSRNL